MTTINRYSGLQIALHWGIALLILINWLTGEAMIAAFDGKYEEGLDKTSVQSNLHVYLGLAILALALLRLITRWGQGVPAADHSGSALMRIGAEVAHWALYAAMIGVPALGAVAWYLGLGTIGDLHVLTMNLMLAVIGLHAVAGLFHHYVLKDGLIHRMNPFAR